MKLDTVDIATLRGARKITLNRRDADGYAKFDRLVGAEEAMELISSGYTATSGETGYINMNTMKMRTTGYMVELYPPK